MYVSQESVHVGAEGAWRQRRRDDHHAAHVPSPQHDRMKDELDALARSTGRNRSTLVQEALRRFIDVQRWQLAGIEAGVRHADAGNVISEEIMNAMWAEFGLETEKASPFSTTGSNGRR